MEIPLKKVFAQSNTSAHPTIPFNPTGGSTTPTPTTTTVGPIITLSTTKTNYAVGEIGEIEIKIDTKTQSIDEFKIVVIFDSSHITILDSDTNQVGIQVQYLDTHYGEIENKTETNLAGTAAGADGKITVSAAAQNDQATSISNRVIGKIRFQVKASKSSTLTVRGTESSLLLNNVNILDNNSLKSITITSSGQVTPTPTSTVPTIPDTALNTPESFAIITIGILLVVAGVALKNKISQRKHIS